MRLDSKYKANDCVIPPLTQNRDALVKKHNFNTRTLIAIVKGGVTTDATAHKICEGLQMSLDKAFTLTNADKGLSAKTIVHHHRVISTVLATAVQWQIITTNVAERVKPPKVEKTEASHYDDAAVLEMFKLLAKEPLKYQAAIYIALYGGLRLGEVTGLDWTDVDFNTGIINISKTSQYLPDKGIFEKSTKNVSSTRKIILSETAIQILRLYKVEQSEERLKLGNLWEDSGKVFVQWNGKPMFPSTPSGWFRDWLKRNNMPHLTFHQLRHTNASLLISQGVDIATVSKRLGHSKISTTTDIYTHAISKLDSSAAVTLDNLLADKSKLNTSNNL